MSEVSEAMGRAAQLRRQNKIAEAMAAYGAILSRWPKFADAWYNLAILQRETFDSKTRSIPTSGRWPAGIARPEEVHLNRSVIYSDCLRDHAAAAAELQHALTLNPGYAHALLNLAILYEDLGKRAEASSLYARILAIEPARASKRWRVSPIYNPRTASMRGSSSVCKAHWARPRPGAIAPAWGLRSAACSTPGRATLRHSPLMTAANAASFGERSERGSLPMIARNSAGTSIA